MQDQKLAVKLRLRWISVTLIVVLLASPMALSFRTSSAQNVTSSASQYPDYALSLLNPNDRLTLQTLEKISNGSQSVSSFEKVIQDYFLPLNIRRVLLDFGWQNYTIGSLPYEQWITNWLSACDSLGIQNVFYAGQFTTAGIDSPWAMSLIAKDPAAGTYYSNGSPAQYIDLSSPDIKMQMEQDLSTLFGYYGRYSSWVGIGTGSSSSNNPYYAQNSTMPLFGYSNTTIANFANSVYFRQDVSATGYDPNGLLDPLWSSFVSTEPAVLLSSGNWMTSSAVEVYPGGQNALAMKLYLPNNEKAIKVMFYGNRVGNPGSVSAELFADENGTFVRKSILASGNLSSVSVSTVAGWQSPISLSGTFSAGYYWILLSAQSGDSADYYDIYSRNYHVDNSEVLSGQSSSGAYSNIGSSILWIKDSSGANLTIYPFEQALVGVLSPQTFIAKSSYSFNTVFLFLSDRHYNTVNGTISIKDAATGKIVATGVLSQSLTQGLQNWIPVSLNTTVTTTSGTTYSMQVSDNNGGDSWYVVQRGLSVSPASSGFQNQSQFWLFRLGYATWQAGHLDFTSMTANGVDSVKSGHPDAIRFTSPSSLTSLSQVSILMSNSNPSGQFYAPGTTLTVSIARDNVTSSQPAGSQPAAGPPLQTINIGGQLVPQNGWLNVTGLSLPLSSYTNYWAVFSTNSTDANFPMARLVSPYNLPTLVSLDSGTTWSYPAEGPTEFSFITTFSNGEQTGNFIENVPHVIIGPSDEFAQPFISSGSQALGVYLGPIVGTSVSSNYIVVSINPDDGGKPSSAPLSSGVFYSGNITLDFGPQLVQFSSVARLVAGEKYWIVVRPVIGDFALLPVVYTKAPKSFPSGLSAQISIDGGFTWKYAENETAILTFLIASSPVTLPEYSTSSLFSDLSNYHDFPVIPSDLRGWNAYLESSKLSNYQNIATWAQALTGREFRFFAYGDPTLSSVLGLGSIVLSQNNLTESCAGLLQYLLAQVPYQNIQYHEINSLSTLEACLPSTVQPLAQELNYMLYPGGSFGSMTIFNVLALGSGQSNITHYLSTFLNVTYIPVGAGTNLTFLGKYRAVLWLPESSLSEYSSLESELESYVSGGGNLVILETPQSWMNNLIGFDPGSFKPNGNSVGGSASSLLTDSVAHTAYSSSLKLGAVSSSASVVQASGLLVSLNSFGSGRTVFIQTNSPLSQVSDGAVLVGNVLSNLVGLNATSPLWYANSGTGAMSLVYNIAGSSRGPLLVWLSNPTSSPISFSLELDAQFFGLQGNWKTIDLLDLSTTSGSGSQISLDFTVPPDSWEPVYIFQDTTNLVSSYSSMMMSGHKSFPNQFLYEFSTANQTAIVALASSSPVSAVQLAGGENLTQFNQSKDLLNSTGWYYNPQSGVLIVKYSNSNELRVFLSLVSQGFPTLTVLWLAVGGMIAAEAAVLVYFKVKSRLPNFRELAGQIENHS